MNNLVSWSVSFFLASVSGMERSSGCGKENTYNIEQLSLKNINVTDSNQLEATREFLYRIPSNYIADVAMPLFFHYHGQFLHANFTAGEWKGNSVISIFPQGMDDSSGKRCGTGWNTGPSGHDDNTCNFVAWAQTCCYASCLEIGACTGDGRKANCGWSTCYDDGQFFSDMYEMITDALCIDLDRVFIEGFSNGGMLTHNLYSRFPTKFRAVFPANSLPLRGYINVPEALKGTSIFMTNARGDNYIPQAGGFGFGWYYASAEAVLLEFARVNDCNLISRRVQTPYDGGLKDLACVEWENCSGETRVMHCNHDGGHAGRPEDWEALTMWFVGELGSFDTKLGNEVRPVS